MFGCFREANALTSWKNSLRPRYRLSANRSWIGTTRPLGSRRAIFLGMNSLITTSWPESSISAW